MSVSGREVVSACFFVIKKAKAFLSSSVLNYQNLQPCWLIAAVTGLQQSGQGNVHR